MGQFRSLRRVIVFFVGELSDFCVDTLFVLTRFSWKLHVVTRLVFNDCTVYCVIGEGLGDSSYRNVKGIIVSALLFRGMVWFDS